MSALTSSQPDRRRQRLLVLGALALVLGAVVWYQLRPPAGRPAPASNPSARGTGPAADTKITLPEVVKLDELADVPRQSEVGRNPFGYGIRPAPPPPPQVARPPVPITPPPPPEPQGPPPITLRLTGLTVVPGSGRTMVTLKDQSGTLFQAFEGDVVDGRYRVVKVGTQSVVVGYLDGTGQRTIPLGG